MVKKIWTDGDYQLEVSYCEKNEEKKESTIQLLIDDADDYYRFGIIQLDKEDVSELIEELKLWLDILEEDSKK